MKVKEAIKNLENYVVTRNGKILRINNVCGSNIHEDELLNSEVLKIQVIKGMFANTTCIRI